MSYCYENKCTKCKAMIVIYEDSNFLESQWCDSCIIDLEDKEARLREEGTPHPPSFPRKIETENRDE